MTAYISPGGGRGGGRDTGHKAGAHVSHPPATRCGEATHFPRGLSFPLCQREEQSISSSGGSPLRGPHSSPGL